MKSYYAYAEKFLRKANVTDYSQDDIKALIADSVVNEKVDPALLKIKLTEKYAISSSMQDKDFSSIKRELHSMRVYYYSDADVKNLKEQSTVGGLLDYALLRMNISEFYKTVSERQESIHSKIVAVTKSSVVPQRLIRSVCAYEIGNAPNPNQTLSYISYRNKEIISRFFYLFMPLYAFFALCLIAGSIFCFCFFREFSFYNETLLLTSGIASLCLLPLVAIMGTMVISVRIKGKLTFDPKIFFTISSVICGLVLLLVAMILWGAIT